MATVLCVWTQEEVRSVIRFLWAKGTAPIEIHREIQAVYGPDVNLVKSYRKSSKSLWKPYVPPSYISVWPLYRAPNYAILDLPDT